MRKIKNGLDSTSLLGSYITTNDKFIFVSANGFNIFNGMILVYYKNVTYNRNNIPGLKEHSIIDSPESFNTNFGIRTAATNKLLAVTGISYDAYKGVVYIYKFVKNLWIYISKMEGKSCKRFELIGFGYNIHFLGKQLFINKFNSQVDEYLYDEITQKMVFNKSVITSENNNSYVYTNLASDNNQNLFITNMSNTITIFNPEYNVYAYFNKMHEFFNGNEKNCFFGSNLFIYKKTLFVACSLYYPFINIPDNLYTQVYIYDIIYENNSSIITNLRLTDVINSPNNDPYFGNNLNAYDRHLLVGGFNSVYYYYYLDSGWDLKNIYLIYGLSYNSYNSFNLNNLYNLYSVNNSYNLYIFDLKIQILEEHFIVGCYGFNDLEGAIFIDNMIEREGPSGINDNSKITDYINSNSRKVYILTILIIGIMFTVLLVVVSYITLSLVVTAPLDKKKKKPEDEELSPYKVYSYLGYRENDESMYYPNHVNPHFYNTYIPGFVNVNANANTNTNANTNASANANTNASTNASTNANLAMEQEIAPKDKKRILHLDTISKERVVSYKGYVYDSIQDKYKSTIKPILKEFKESKNNNT